MTPDFAAILYSYNTRSNYFTLKIKNNSKKSIIIQKGTTKVIDCDYKSFDRKVTLSKSQTIKPGQTKTIKFKVKGSTTWRHVNDFTLYYYFKLDGKKYYAKADVLNTSKYKKGSSWKNTYAKKTWYEDFVCEIY